MDRHNTAESRSLINRRLELRGRILIRRMQHAIQHGVRPGFIHFNEVRSFLMLLPDRGNNFIRVVGIGRVGQDLLCGIEVIGVFMAAEYIDRISRDAQSRTLDQTFVDRVAHRAVGGTRALGTHVPFGGKTRHQVIFGCQNREDGPLRHGLLDRL